MAFLTEEELASCRPSAKLAQSPITPEAVDVHASCEMLMRDPEVNKQSDLLPYPNGPAKIIHKWDVSITFRPIAQSPVFISVKGIDGGSAGTIPGWAFDGIEDDGVYSDTGLRVQENYAGGCFVLHNSDIGESEAPVFISSANPFPDADLEYPHLRINEYGRWFIVRWYLSTADDQPAWKVRADQQPWVQSIDQRVC